MALTPNKFGRYKIEDVLGEGYPIIGYGFTATEIKEMTGISLTVEQRLAFCIGFSYKKEWRGCVPVFDVMEIALKKENGELDLYDGW